MRCVIDIRAAIGRKGHQSRAVHRAMGGVTLKWLVPFAETVAGGTAIVVLLTRLAPRTLDSDNLQAALKSIRDAVADRLGADDNNPLIHWEYWQVESEKVGVNIEMRAT